MNKCVVCGNETNGKYLNISVCFNCYENRSLQAWLSEQSPLPITTSNNFDETMNNISEHKKRCFIWYLLGMASSANEKYFDMKAEKLFTTIYSDFNSEFEEAENND